MKYRTKVNDWDQKASLKVGAMVFNTAYYQESNMAANDF